MDAFYVSIEMLRHPELRGKPVVVAHDGPRGVVTTASYAAREFGVHSALPMVTARRRCPELTVLPVDMQLYRRGSRKVMESLRRVQRHGRGGRARRGLRRPGGVPGAAVAGARDQGPDQGRDPPGLLDRAWAEQADGEDRLGPGQARRPVRAERAELARDASASGPPRCFQASAPRPSSACAAWASRPWPTSPPRTRRPWSAASARATAPPYGSSETASAPPRSRPSASASPRAGRPHSPMTSATRTRWRRR